MDAERRIHDGFAGPPRAAESVEDATEILF
jgi:hypothetical protein